MNNAGRVAFEELRSLEFNFISSDLEAIAPVFEHPIRIMKISNSTDTDVFISFNNIENQDFIPSNSFVLYDFTANLSLTPGQFSMPANTTVYVADNGTAATSGAVYVTAIYGTTR